MNGKLLIPRSANQDIVACVELLRTETEAPNGLSRLIDRGELSAVLVAQQNLSIVKSDSQNLTIWRPITVHALHLGYELVDVLPFSLPKTKIVVGARGQTLKHRIEAKRLHSSIVRVLKKADTLC